jgi:hypothetical protein
MRRMTRATRLTSVLLSVSAAALLIAAALPHSHHEQRASSHAAQSCRLCRISDSLSAAPPRVSLVLPVPAVVVLTLRPQDAAPGQRLAVCRFSPRAPPACS